MMQHPEHTITQVTDEYPVGLKTAAELATNLGDGITEARVLELAAAGYMPHYRIDSGPPLFKASEVRRWVASNLLRRVTGRAIPSALRVVTNAEPVFDAPPMCISSLPGLQQIRSVDYCPGVYFLCRGRDVVYVGQSKAPAGRIATHRSSGEKAFDRVYLLPVPESELNDVEHAFIHLLRPPLQGGIRSGRDTPTAPRSSRTVEETLASIGFSPVTSPAAE
jgi:hypothetical protein